MAKLQEEIKQYVDLEKFEAEVEVLETMEKQVIRMEQASIKLEALIENILSVKELIRQESDILVIETQLTQILEKLAIKKVRAGEYIRLQELLWQIKENGHETAKLELLLPAGEGISNILTLIERRKLKTAEYSRLEFLLTNISQNKISIDKQQLEYEQLHETFHKEMGEVCILCGQKVKV